MFNRLSNPASPDSIVKIWNLADQHHVSASESRLDVYQQPQLSQRIDNQREFIRPLISKMGAIQSKDGRRLGTCGLVRKDLVMTARHVVEAMRVKDLVVKFDYTNGQKPLGFQSCQVALDAVVEDDPEYDYAIIKLKAPIGEQLGYVNLNLEDSDPGETVLLHYPLEEDLKVSVGALDQQDPLYAQGFHDTNHCSSGGFHVDLQGRVTAIHLGAEIAGDRSNLLKYAIKVQAIVARHPNSLLSNPSNAIASSKNYLESYIRRFSIDEEGGESQKLFTNALGTRGIVDRKLKKVNGGETVSFLEKNLEYLTVRYSPEFNNVCNECLYLTGPHSFTKEYAIAGYIESDHIIPHHVWASTTQKKMKALAKGGGKRPGENEMPAITIPYDKHRDLRTTGNGAAQKKFHQKLIDLCNKGEVDRAFIKCVKEYKRVGIDLTTEKVKKAVEGCLDLCIKIGVINKKKRIEVMNRYAELNQPI